MPRFSKFSTTAQVRYRDNAALIQPETTMCLEFRGEGDAVSTVTSENSWVFAIQACPSFLDNREWNLCAVPGLGCVTDRFDVGKHRRGPAGKQRPLNSISVTRRIVCPPGVRLRVSYGSEKDFIALRYLKFLEAAGNPLGCPAKHPICRIKVVQIMQFSGTAVKQKNIEPAG